MALCHITGTVYLPDGTVAANRTVEFYKTAFNTVTADYLGAVVPEMIKTRLDKDGKIDQRLITGVYIGRLLDRNGQKLYEFKAVVPDAASARFEDIITAADPVEPSPAWLQQVFEARDEAFEAVADAGADRIAAQAAAAQAEASRMEAAGYAAGAAFAGNWYDTIALGRSSVADGQTFGVRPGGTDGLTRPTVYRRDSSTTQSLIVSPPTGSEFDDEVARLQALESTVTSVVNKSVIEYALQEVAALPVRPDAHIVHWYTWSDPTEYMGPADLWFQLPTPTIPSMPLENSWRVYDARTGDAVYLQILSVPKPRLPALTHILYSINGGAWLEAPVAVGAIEISGLAEDQPITVQLAYRNYLGIGIPSTTRSVTPTNNPFTDNFDRANENLSASPSYKDIVYTGTRKMQIGSNVVRPAGINETYVVQVTEAFPADQYIQVQVLGTGANTNAARGVRLFVRMPDGVADGYALRMTANAWVLARVKDGVATSLTSGTLASRPLTARLSVVGNVLTVSFDAVIASTFTDTSPDAFTEGFVGMGLNVAGAEAVTAMTFDNLQAGRAV